MYRVKCYKNTYILKCIYCNLQDLELFNKNVFLIVNEVELFHNLKKISDSI